VIINVSDAVGEWRQSSTLALTCHFTEFLCYFTPRPQYLGKEPPHLLKTMLVGPKNSYGRSAVPVNWNTIRRSASPHPTPDVGGNKLPAIPNIPLVQAGPRARPCGFCGGQSNIQRNVSSTTYNFPSVSFHQVSVHVFHSSTSATIIYNLAVLKVINKTSLAGARAHTHTHTHTLTHGNFINHREKF